VKKMAHNDLRYKRDEPYRFEFIEPISANFYIDKPALNVNQFTTNELKLVDISLRGIKIETDLNIPLIEDITLTTNIKIGSYNFTLIGNIVWRKRVTSSQFNYGIKLTSTDHQNYLKYALIEYRQAIKTQIQD
jgi:hypothetical protein